MPLTKRKTRTISLRLSDEDYEALKGVYAAHGARSISEFARLAMHRVLSCPPGDSVTLEMKIQELDGKVTLLVDLARIEQLLESEAAARHRALAGLK